jgi:hypothetical protein
MQSGGLAATERGVDAAFGGRDGKGVGTGRIDGWKIEAVTTVTCFGVGRWTLLSTNSSRLV